MVFTTGMVLFGIREPLSQGSSSRTVYAHTTWPEVIGRWFRFRQMARTNLEQRQQVRRSGPLQCSPSNLIDVPQHKSTNELLFPAFHPEILQQAHWDAGEQLGRIKIVISEGIMSASSPLTPDKLAFDRLRDIIVFSFQHAPQSKSIDMAWHAG